MGEWHKLHRILETGPAPHKLTAVDKERRTAICSVCGPVKIVLKQGSPTCWTRHKEWQARYRQTLWAAKREAKRRFKEENAMPSGGDYRRFLKASCERCGFTAIHECQLDIHHRDGNRLNNHVSNLATLCPSCHRIEHLSEGVKRTLSIPESTKVGMLAACGKTPDQALAGLDAEEIGMLKREIDVLKENQKRLLDDIAAKDQKMAHWQDRFEKSVGATESQMALFWKARHDKIARKLAELEA